MRKDGNNTMKNLIGLIGILMVMVCSVPTAMASDEEQQYDSYCRDKIMGKSYSLQGVGYVEASEVKRWTTGVIYNPERRPPQYRATYNVFGQYKGNLMKIGTAKCDIYNYGNGNIEVHTQ